MKTKRNKRNRRRIPGMVFLLTVMTLPCVMNTPAWGTEETGRIKKEENNMWVYMDIAEGVIEELRDNPTENGVYYKLDQEDLTDLRISIERSMEDELMPGFTNEAQDGIRRYPHKYHITLYTETESESQTYLMDEYGRLWEELESGRQGPVKQWFAETLRKIESLVQDGELMIWPL